MANSVFIFPGNVQYSGTIATNSGFLANDGSAATPSYSFASDTDTGSYWIGANNQGFSASGTLRWDYNTTRILSSIPFQGPAGTGSAVAFGIGAANSGWYSNVANEFMFAIAGSDKFHLHANYIQIPSATYFAWGTLGFDAGTTRLYEDAANTLALRNGTNPQTYRIYGYLSGSRLTRGSLHSVTEAITLSGASTSTTAFIPKGAIVQGVAITITTAITGASGYTAGDGTDVDRYGDITGTATGTKSDNTDATADPSGYVAAASAITLTAKTSNFTGGVAQVTVFYLTTAAA